MKLSILTVLIVVLFVGCGHNRYNETKSWGVGLSVPLGDVGQLSLCLGSTETTIAMVRGGSSFNTETIAGAGIFSGAGGTAKVTTFRSNEQLNEGNVVKIMESPDVPDKVKVELAQNFKKAAEAPEIEPSAMQVREAALYANGYKGELTNQFKDTGVDKVVDSVENIVEDVADNTAEIITSTTDSITDAVVDTTGNLTKAQAWGAIGTFLMVVLSVFWYKYTKSRQQPTKKSSSTPGSIPTPSPPEDDINPPEMEDVDVPQEDSSPEAPHKSKLSSAMDAAESVLDMLGNLTDEQKGYLKKSVSTIIGGNKSQQTKKKE